MAGSGLGTSDVCLGLDKVRLRTGKLGSRRSGQGTSESWAIWQS